MINDMKLRGFSKKTLYAYVSAVAGLAKFYNQSPDRIEKDKVQAYLLHLMDKRKMSWSTCNVVVSGLRFFYIETLGRDSVYLDIPPRKKKEQLPVNCQSRAQDAVDDHICRRIKGQ
jgi:site-specific recombinase XerD